MCTSGAAARAGRCGGARAAAGDVQFGSAAPTYARLHRLAARRAGAPLPGVAQAAACLRPGRTAERLFARRAVPWREIRSCPSACPGTGSVMALLEAERRALPPQAASVTPVPAPNLLQPARARILGNRKRSLRRARECKSAHHKRPAGRKKRHRRSESKTMLPPQRASRRAPVDSGREAARSAFAGILHLPPRRNGRQRPGAPRPPRAALALQRRRRRPGAPQPMRLLRRRRAPAIRRLRSWG